MAKKRKTLRDKQRAALRQSGSKHEAAIHVEQQVQQNEPLQEERQKFTFTSSNAPTRTLHTNETYTYLLHDLKKTVLITGSIILAQLALFYTMHGI